MKKGFIAFGKDYLAALELKNFLNKLDIEPIILDEQPDLGLSVVEKFEKYAKQCNVAFIIMSPDDNVKDKLGSEFYAARQNVIMELGWFMRHVGRSNIIIIHKEGTHIPSNISGILFLPYKQSILEISERIRDRLNSIR